MAPSHHIVFADPDWRVFVHLRPRAGECTFFDAETEVNLEHQGG